MSSFLRNLSPSNQVGLLFVVVFGLLIVAGIAALVMSLRDSGEDDIRTQDIKEFSSLLNTSWIMCTVFWIGWALGETVATLLFALVAFFRPARIHHAVADPARRPPQPGAGFFWGAAGPVLAGHDRAL
jgi:hypothetical protein